MLVKIINIMLENTYTTDDLVGRIGFMRTYYASTLFQSGSQSVNTSPESVLRSVEPDTLQCLVQWHEKFQMERIQPLVIYEALDAIEEEIVGLPTVLLYVPIHFSNEHVALFGGWFRENVQPNILLTIRSDPRMAGGCGFVWNNIFYDFSFGYYLDKKKNELLKLLDSHIPHASQ
jgi:hypothetical protein